MIDGLLVKVDLVPQLVLSEEVAGIFKGCQMKAMAFGVDVPSLVRSLAFVGGEQVLAVHVGRMVQVAGSDADQMAAAALLPNMGSKGVWLLRALEECPSDLL